MQRKLIGICARGGRIRVIFGGPLPRHKWFFRDVDGGDGFRTLLAPGEQEGGVDVCVRRRV